MKALRAKDGKQWPGPFPAVQWIGEIQPLKDFLIAPEVFVSVAVKIMKATVIDDDGNKLDLYEGDWLVRDGGGVLRVTEDADVRLLYFIEEATP